MPSKLGAITSSVVSVIYIDFEDFKNVISRYPLDYEKYCTIKDNINVNNNYRGTGIKCLSCNNFKHKFS